MSKVRIKLWDWIEHDDGLRHMSARRTGRWCEWKDAKAIIDAQREEILRLRESIQLLKIKTVKF